jgi:four helix bundle protein
MRNTKVQPSKSKETSTVNLQTRATAAAWPGAELLTRSDWELKEDPVPVPALHPFDFEERTARFGEAIVRFSKRIPRSPTNDRLISQLVGAGTSVGANFCEASDSVSRKDFRHSAKRCIKEAKETRFFLRMVATSETSLGEEARALYRESTELIRILASMCRKS